MEAGGGAWLPVARHPVSQPMGKRGILDETGVQLGPMGVRSPMCERLGASPTLPGEGAASPSVPLKAVSFSGRFSSSLYFWSQRNSYRGKKTSAEQAVSRQSSQHGGPLPRASSPTGWLRLAGQGGSLQCLSWPPVNPQGRSAKSILWAGRMLGSLGWGPEGLL